MLRNKILILTLLMFTVITSSCGITDPETPSNAMQITTTGNNYNPQWSPTGNHVAYSSGDEEGPRQIFVRNLSQKLDSKITKSGINNEITWSPDGFQFAFLSNIDDGIWVYDFDNTIPAYKIIHDVNFRVGSIDWSHDGKYIAVSTSDDMSAPGKIALVNVSDGSFETLNIQGNNPVWGAEDSVLYYFSFQETDYYVDFEQWVIRYNVLSEKNDTLYIGKKIYASRGDEGMIGDIAISPNENWLAFTNQNTTGGGGIPFSTGGFSQNIVLVSLRANSTVIDTFITSNRSSSSPSWSPDGEKIVFVSDGDLWIKDLTDIVN